MLDRELSNTHTGIISNRATSPLAKLLPLEAVLVCLVCEIRAFGTLMLAIYLCILKARYISAMRTVLNDSNIGQPLRRRSMGSILLWIRLRSSYGLSFLESSFKLHFN